MAKTKLEVKASVQHNRGVKVKAGLRAGGVWAQHNRGVKVKAGVRAGGFSTQHSRALRRL